VSIDLIVEAELIDPGPEMPPPGIFHGVALTHYRVLRVVEGEYSDPDLYVGHDGASRGNPAFRPGARHRLYLTRAFPEGVSVVGLEKAGPSGAYFCVRYERLDA
jgi:hypothetical protein